MFPVTHRTSLARRLKARRQGLGQINQGELASTLRSAAMSAARSSIDRIVIRSNITPDEIVISDPAEYFTRPRGKFSEILMSAVAPEIQIDTVAGSVLLAPFGRPRTNLFWPVVILGTGALVAVGALVAKGLRR